MSTPQQIARDYLREFVATCAPEDMHLVTDESDLWMQASSDGLTLESYLWVDTVSQVADLTVRWVAGPGETYQSAEDNDMLGADYGDVSLRHMQSLPARVRLRVLRIVAQVLRDAGYDPDMFSIGGTSKTTPPSNN